ncbi:DUF2812 domain-containing protein [Niallia alba]|uniref:DUF2812 domain-containing protein n=1 Tax=Niallia alba TaxID=2729105 RepID=UPI002E21ABAB|nr:DUF2812 domain-containing protein [Niallia alba]
MIKKVKRNIFKNFFLPIEKEEAWLNDMCKKGYALKEISNSYYLFEACTPSKFIYRIEFLKQGGSQEEKNNYLAFMEELNVEYVASTNRWHYFRRDAGLGAFEIYSDIDSQIEHYQRINFIWWILAMIFLYSGLSSNILLRGTDIFEIILNTVLVLIGVFFLILAFPLTKKIYFLKKKKKLLQ